MQITETANAVASFTGPCITIIMGMSRFVGPSSKGIYGPWIYLLSHVQNMAMAITRFGPSLQCRSNCYDHTEPRADGIWYVCKHLCVLPAFPGPPWVRIYGPVNTQTIHLCWTLYTGAIDKCHMPFGLLYLAVPRGSHWCRSSKGWLYRK